MDYNFVKETSDGKKLKKKVKDPKTQVSYEKHGHTSDANDYFLIEFFRVDYKIYLSGGKTSNGFISKTKTNNKTY